MSLNMYAGFEPSEPDSPVDVMRSHVSRLRRMCAVCVLCCVGMLVVTSLFASPARRAAYRTAPADMPRHPLIGSPSGSGAQGSAPTGKADNC